MRNIALPPVPTDPGIVETGEFSNFKGSKTFESDLKKKCGRVRKFGYLTKTGWGNLGIDSEYVDFECEELVNIL